MRTHWMLGRASSLLGLVLPDVSLRSIPIAVYSFRAQ